MAKDEFIIWKNVSGKNAAYEISFFEAVTKKKCVNKSLFAFTGAEITQCNWQLNLLIGEVEWTLIKWSMSENISYK